MVSEWQAKPLADCMSAIIDYRGKTPKKTVKGIPLVTAKVVKGGRITGFNEFIATEYYDEWMRRGLPMHGDVVMTMEAPLGEVAQLDGTRVALGQRIITLRGKEDLLDNTYLKYHLQSDYVQHQLHSRATGTTVLGIKQSELRNVLLLLPPLDEQRAIARILGALDDKIELNRQMNKTLEDIASAIFKSWFIDFDPVIAKSEGKQPFGMSSDVAALFPDSFEETENGPIPRGWKLCPLNQIFYVNPKRILKNGELAPYLEMANMPVDNHVPYGWTMRPAGSGMRFMNGDTLLARITPCLENGKTAFVDFLEDGKIGWGSTEYIVLRPKEPIPDQFAYCLCRYQSFRDFAVQTMSGSSGRQRVSNDALVKYQLTMPSNEAITEVFGRVIKPLFRKSNTNARESRTLSTIRDALLPKLISGEIRAKQAEKMVEAVV